MQLPTNEKMVVWLEVNPTKTERDWLVAQRCSTDQQRSDLNRLLDLCDYPGVKDIYSASTNQTYLPWGKELKNTDLSGLKGWNITTGLVSSFYQQLFKDDIEKARKKIA